MADSGPAMSGAKDSAAEETPVMLPPAAETTASTEATETAETAETAAMQAAQSDKPSTVAAAAPASKDKQKEKEPAAGQPESSSATAAASAAASTSVADSETAVPQPPPAAVIRPRTDSLAIGSADDAALPGDGLVVCNITLLLPTGARHPYRIDEKYLARRSVDVPGVTEGGQKDPFSISIYKLKELILREWREDWEGKPASPSSIRLIHFGKLLEDKEQLKKYHFSAEAPNVVHMSVKPAEMLEEDEAGKGKNANRDPNHHEGGGCCVIL